MVRRLMHFIFAIVLVSTSVTLSNRVKMFRRLMHFIFATVLVLTSVNFSNRGRSHGHSHLPGGLHDGANEPNCLGLIHIPPCVGKFQVAPRHPVALLYFRTGQNPRSRAMEPSSGLPVSGDCQAKWIGSNDRLFRVWGIPGPKSFQCTSRRRGDKSYVHDGKSMGKLLSKNQNFTAVEGTTVKLPCEADEPEETAIQWSKETENETIRIYSSTFRQIPDLRFQMNPDTYTLSIDKVNKHDSGVFTCDDGETTIVHQLSVIPPNASKSDSLIVGLVVLAILACVAIVAGVIYARKRKAQYQPANSPRR